MIEANWGLGTTVVEGLVSPDHFVVDKITGLVKEEKGGSKSFSMWLDPKRGTVERQTLSPGDRTLTDAQLIEVTEVICRIERLYDAPVDIEWAYAGGMLHVLQARPITTYVPLPSAMLTSAGERRQLYSDASLSKGLTTNEPLSTMGLDNMKSLFSSIVESWVGPLNNELSPKDALFFFAGSRMYVNYSNVMWMVSPRTLAKSAAPTDALMAQILGNVDREQYRTDARPTWARLGSLALVPRALWSLRSFLFNALFAVLAPVRAERRFRGIISDFELELREQIDDGLSLIEFRRKYEARMAREMFGVMMPMVLAGMVSPALVVRSKSEAMRALVAKLERGATGNVVVEMGVALYRLAGRLDKSEFADLNSLAERIQKRELPPAFMREWDNFVSRFGWRGPMEMDLASPRYADAPHLALRQMSLMAVDDDDFDPGATHERNVEERQDAYAELMRHLGPVRRGLLRRVYKLFDLFAGARDTPKHLIVLFNYAIRKRALIQGRRLTEEGRLDAAEHVFDLQFADLDDAAKDATLDLRRLREERTHFRKKLDAHVTAFPAVIDSRGRILGPPATEATPGLLSGMPVSPGVVTGPVRVLHSPHEKTVEKGDVLVAYTTDPGWTPLFVSAAAVVLEVGGVLQHGALVAREYGKPCVVGIYGVVATLQDGELVEVNGSTGTVRRLSMQETVRSAKTATSQAREIPDSVRVQSGCR